MLSPLKPLLCRHDFYWSERHLSDRCRRCGKLRAVEVGGFTDRAPSPALNALPEFAAADGAFVHLRELAPSPVVRSPETVKPSAKVLKAEARERRETLLGLLDRLIDGQRPSRAEAIDAVLAVIEDAHSADPVVFGVDAAGHFARLHEARSAPRC